MVQCDYQKSKAATKVSKISMSIFNCFQNKRFSIYYVIHIRSSDSKSRSKKEYHYSVYSLPSNLSIHESENLIQSCHSLHNIIRIEAEWWLDLQNIRVRTIGVQKDSKRFTEGEDGCDSEFLVGFTGLTVFDQIDSPEKADSSETYIIGIISGK